MKLYGGIDLHSNNSVLALVDEQDKVVYQRRLANELDLAPMVEDIAELYEPVAAEKNQYLNAEVTGKLVILGGRDLLFEALANLVDSAIKYTPQGGRITLRAEARYD